MGKLDRSTYLASYYDDELLRRRVNTKLNRQESRHTLARPHHRARVAWSDLRCQRM
ncbi:Tn3 family transposase [Nonomuraea bangladeshensis]